LKTEFKNLVPKVTNKAGDKKQAGWPTTKCVVVALTSMLAPTYPPTQ